MSAKIRRFRITGRVQGVYFRHSTRLEAERLGVTGHATNLEDGSVEVLACGSESALESLRLWLHRGPPSARVHAVSEIEADGEAGPPAGFEIR